MLLLPEPQTATIPVFERVVNAAYSLEVTTLVMHNGCIYLDNRLMHDATNEEVLFSRYS